MRAIDTNSKGKPLTGRLVVVSNRVSVLTGRKAASAGGLAVGVHSALAAAGGVWFGWSGEVHADADTSVKTQRVGKITYLLTDLTEDEHAGYYAGFANRTLWPLFHYRIDLTVFDRGWHDTWRQVNRRFAEQLMAHLRPDDRVWVQDYHLIPMGRELRALGFEGRIGFFLHIPFPSPELYLALPWYKSIVEDFCAYDVAGFQTPSDLHQFHELVRLEMGARIGEDGVVRLPDHDLVAGAFPIGIDVDDVARMAVGLDGRRHADRLRATLMGRPLIIGVDRLDYSKGIPERLRAFEQLLREHPAFHNQVVYVQISAPSREDVPEYQSLRRTVERLAGHINGRLGAADWTPVRYVNRSYTRRALSGFFRASRVGLVTPLRDGMNLVAAEYVAAQDQEDPGVLVLSRFAGAAGYMDGAVVVNPYDATMTAAALNQALSMSLEERQARHAVMLRAVRRNDINAWRDQFLAALDAEPVRQAAA
jgi:trehalose 6-phosphate synthase